MSLYNLTDEFIELYDAEDVDEDKLQSVALAIKTKAEGAALFVKTLEADSKMLESVINELQSKKKAIDNKAKNFKEYVKLNLEKMGLDKLEAGIYKFAIQKNGGKQPITLILPPEKIDSKYHKITIDIDKEAILADFEETGVVTAGVVIEERGTHLRVR